MGAAATHRGDAVIRRQADEACRRIPMPTVPPRWEDDRAELLAMLVRLERDRERAVACIRRLELTLTDERRRYAAEREQLLHRAHSAERWAIQMQRRWRWVSLIVRRFVTPAQVQAFREEP